VGVFFEQVPQSNLAAMVERELQEALRTDPHSVDTEAEAAVRSKAVTAAMRSGTFKTSSFMVALAILGVFVAGAVVADAVNLDDSSKALYGFATTTLGIIVGLIGGEKTST